LELHSIRDGVARDVEFYPSEPPSEAVLYHRTGLFNETLNPLLGRICSATAANGRVTVYDVHVVHVPTGVLVPGFLLSTVLKRAGFFSLAAIVEDGGGWGVEGEGEVLGNVVQERFLFQCKRAGGRHSTLLR
jgi:hypothetical protein